MPIAFITGVTGQDGSYLSEWLLSQGYQVHGLIRQTTSPDQTWIQPLVANAEIYGKRFFLHTGELTDPTRLRRILNKVAPDELYHLAGQTHVGLSFEIPEQTCELTAMATLRLLEICRDLSKNPKFFYASSSEIFGRPTQAPQDETCPFRPLNPYGCAKAFATQLVGVFRNSFKLFASCGIFYNHESPRRGSNFVTSKICRGAAAIHLGLQKELVLGNLDVRRDWGDARDYVRGMWMTLQHSKPDDFIFATGKTHSLQDVLEIAFKEVNLTWQNYVRQDPQFMRPNETTDLIGDPSKAKKILEWNPEFSFESTIQEMTKTEIKRLQGIGAESASR